MRVARSCTEHDYRTVLKRTRLQPHSLALSHCHMHQAHARPHSLARSCSLVTPAHAWEPALTTVAPAMERSLSGCGFVCAGSTGTCYSAGATEPCPCQNLQCWHLAHPASCIGSCCPACKRQGMRCTPEGCSADGKRALPQHSHPECPCMQSLHLSILSLLSMCSMPVPSKSQCWYVTTALCRAGLGAAGRGSCQHQLLDAPAMSGHPRRLAVRCRCILRQHGPSTV